MWLEANPRAPLAIRLEELARIRAAVAELQLTAQERSKRDWRAFLADHRELDPTE